METSFAHHPRLLALVLVIITFVAYIPAIRDGFIWDDERHVTQNVNLRSIHGLYRIWFAPLTDPQYYPLQLTSFWMEYHLWVLWPVGYHAVNILLHALNALLLWMVLQQLEVPGAWLVAAVFAVHPVQVESVAWVSDAGVFPVPTAVGRGTNGLAIRAIRPGRHRAVPLRPVE